MAGSPGCTWPSVSCGFGKFKTASTEALFRGFRLEKALEVKRLSPQGTPDFTMTPSVLVSTSNDPAIPPEPPNPT